MNSLIDCLLSLMLLGLGLVSGWFGLLVVWFPAGVWSLGLVVGGLPLVLASLTSGWLVCWVVVGFFLQLKFLVFGFVPVGLVVGGFEVEVGFGLVIGTWAVSSWFCLVGWLWLGFSGLSGIRLTPSLLSLILSWYIWLGLGLVDGLS